MLYVAGSEDGVYATNDDGSFSDEHTYWKGFANQTATGLRMEWLDAGESAED